MTQFNTRQSKARRRGSTHMGSLWQDRITS